MKERLQQFGGFLAHMIIPNLGAFIAWGLITAFFIPTGWVPNETLAELVGPMIVYLLPILIGFSGGKLVYDTRGGVVGAAGYVCERPDAGVGVGLRLARGRAHEQGRGQQPQRRVSRRMFS